MQSAMHDPNKKGPIATAIGPSEFLERETGLEPATLSLGM
jgi:hypothetical protein